MPVRYTYITIDFFCLVFPFLFSFHPKINFYKQWKYFVLPCIATAIFFLVWDALFTKWGVWSFNPKYVLGMYFFNLPVEELLFFICIPYACVFTYYCTSSFFHFSTVNKKVLIFSWVLAASLFLFALYNWYRLYTSVTFILLAAFLCILNARRVSYLTSFFISFLIILLPFFISNGILTGSFINEPVVVYNKNQNMGIRMFTIPFEDTFYGMLLLLMNVIGFELLRANKKAIL